MTAVGGQFPELDVSEWVRAHEETLGTKPKRWLQDPSTGTYWLMKDRTFNKRSDGSQYPKGDDWAERVAAGIAQQIGLPCANVELATGGPGAETALGVISQSVFGDNESLIHGNELLADIGIVGDDSHDRTGYTVTAVRAALDQVGPTVEAEGASAWETFVGYLVLDALIGNTDRHQENWAVIAGPGGRRLAPTFDHASSLGFQLDDEQRNERLTTSDVNRTPEAYADRAITRFEGKPSPVTVAVEALESLPVEHRQSCLSRCADVEELVAVIYLVPEHRMAEPSKQFAERLLRRNHARLLSHPFGTV